MPNLGGEDLTQEQIDRLNQRDTESGYSGGQVGVTPTLNLRQAYQQQLDRFKTGDAGQAYGDQMMNAINHRLPVVRTNWEAVQAQRQNTAQSYGLQKQALDAIHQRSLGNGPSIANLQGNAAMDAAMRGSPTTGVGLRSALLSNQFGNIGAQAAQARGQEVGQAQSAYGQGAGTMRGQSLQDYGQGLHSAYGAANLNMTQQQQEVERELRLRQLGMMGYQMSAGAQNDLADIAQGIYSDQAARNAQLIGAYANFGGHALAGAIDYGQGKADEWNASQKDAGSYYDPNSGIYRGNPYG